MTLLFGWYKFLVDIGFWLTLHFGWHYFLVDITIWLTLHFGWHYFLPDITFCLKLLFGWHYFLVDITFGWHYILVDFTFWLTLKVTFIQFHRFLVRLPKNVSRRSYTGVAFSFSWTTFLKTVFIMEPNWSCGCVKYVRTKKCSHCQGFPDCGALEAGIFGYKHG